MSPVIPLVIVIFVARIVAARSGGAPAASKRAAFIPGLASGDMFRFLALLAGLGTTAGLAISAGDLAPLCWAGFGLLVAAASVPHLPALVAVRVLPLDLAMLLNGLFSPHWSRGHESARCVLAVLDAQRSVDASTRERLRREISTIREPKPITLLAHAALYDAEGKDEAARDLMLAIDQLPVLSGHLPVRRRARAWLMARAARRGDRERVRELGSGAWAGHSLRSLRAILEAVLDRRPVPRPALVVQALLYGRYRLADALWSWTPPPHLTLPAPVGEATVPDEALLLALRWRRQAVLRMPTLEEWRGFAAAWGALPGREALLDALDARVATVGMRLPPPEDGSPPPRPGFTVLNSLWGDTADVAAHAAALRRQVPPGEGLLAAVRERAEGYLIRTLTVTLAGLGADRRLPMLDNPVLAWLAWQEVRNCADALLAEASGLTRHQALQLLVEPTLDFAVWCWNRAEQRFLGHVVFRWLLAELERVDAPELCDTLRKNIALGY